MSAGSWEGWMVIYDLRAREFRTNYFVLFIAADLRI